MERDTPPIAATTEAPRFSAPSQTDLIAQAPPGTVLLEAKDLTVLFGRFAAVRHATFTLRAGHPPGLIGPNASGTPPLLRALASLQPVAAGTVSILGEPVKPGLEEAARMIGFTPDVPYFYEALSVRQFLNFIAAGYGITA